MSSQPSNFWRQRRVFVTGGTGLLGGWLVRALLSRGAEVVCLVRDWVPQSMLNSSSSLWNRVRVVQGDLADQSLLERALGEYEISTVMHLAAQTIVGIAQRNPLSTFEANIAGTWKLMEACRRSPLVKQIVVASSDKAYGESPRLPYDETQPLAGRHPYDVSKSCSDLIAQTYATTYRSPVCITRCGNLFGGGDLNFNRIVPGTIRSLLAGEAPIIRSDGKMVRDYFYIEDCVEAYLLLAERMAVDPSLAGEAFNFSPDLPLTVLELVQHIQGAMGTNIAPVVLNQPHCEIPQQYLDSTKARERLGWKPLYTLPAALARTIEWYRQQYQREEPCARLQTFPAEVAARSA